MMDKTLFALGAGSLMVILTMLFPAAWAQEGGWGDVDKGAVVYEQYCAECHDTAGAGLMQDMPDFSMGEGLDRSDADLIMFIKKGQGLQPGFEHILSEEDILNVVSYIRTL